MGRRADASLRTGHRMGTPSTIGVKFVIPVASLSAPLRFAGAGGVGAEDSASTLLTSVIARSGATWQSVPLLAVWLRGACPGGHIGPPLRRVEGLREPTGLFVAAVWRRGGTEPAPYTSAGSFCNGPMGASAPTGYGAKTEDCASIGGHAGNPSVSLRLTAPFAQGSLGPRGTRDGGGGKFCPGWGEVLGVPAGRPGEEGFL